MLGACGGRGVDQAAILQAADSSLCNQPPLLIQLHSGGRYTVYATPVDSAALAASLGRYSVPVSVDSAALAVSLDSTLAYRPEDRRAVFLYLDSGRVNTDLAWIVPAVERSGGRAYAGIVCTYTES